MLDLLLKTSPEAVFIYDAENLQFLDVNQSALEIYGYDYNEFIQMDLTDLYAPEDIQTLLDSSNIKNKEREFTGPWRHKKKNGEEILVEISKMKFFYNGNDAYINLVRNVNEKIKNKEESQLFDLVFNNTSEIVFITDTAGVIKKVNNQIVKQLRFEVNEVTNFAFISLVQDSSRDEILKKVFNNSSREAVSLNLRLKSKSSEMLNYVVISKPIINLYDEVVGYTIVAKSSTNTNENVVVKEVQKNYSQIDISLLSGMFHEILTPLNVMLGFMQEITESDEVNKNSELEESVEIINENRSILISTMDDIIEFFQMQQDKIELNKKDVSFIEVFENNFQKLKSEATKENVLLEIGKISSSLIINVDIHKFEKLIYLLIKSASKITEEAVLYFSAYQSEDEYYKLSIKDVYNGITEKLAVNLNLLFQENEIDQFKNEFGISKITIALLLKLADVLKGKPEIIYQDEKPVEFAITFKLTEAKEIFQPYSKEIKFKSEPGSNTDKVIEDIVEKDSKPSNINLKQDQTQVNKGLTQLDLSKLSCLYVEDETASQTLFKVQMRELKNIEFCQSFETAVEKVEKTKYDFIVVDINLRSQYTGVDLMRMIRTTTANTKTPLIAVTAYMLPGDKEKFMAMGFSGFVSKPILKNKMVTVLERIFY